MKNAAHLCPAPGCGRLRERWQAVCRACFARLPADLAERLRAAKRDRARHLEARAAIDATRWLAEHPPADLIARLTGESAPP